MSSPDTPTPPQPGATASLERVVDATMTPAHLPGPGVLSTPSMISLMELACHEAIRAALPAGQTSVGFEVHVFHKAPAHFGQAVVATGTLLETNGRKLTFAVECHCGETLIGEGTHRRAVIQLPAS